jgi:hypothetical protein
MTGLKATSLYLMGALFGFGVACLVVSAHRPYAFSQLSELSPVAGVLAGVWLIAIGLIGGIGLAWGRRTQRLRTVLAAIAFLAVLLCSTVQMHRRAERFAAIADQHMTQMEQFVDGLRPPLPLDEDLTSVNRHVDWHRAMWERFLRASFRPWLPAPPAEQCPDCKTKTGPTDDRR